MKKVLALCLSHIMCVALPSVAHDEQPIEEVRVWGKAQSAQTAGNTGPSSLLNKDDLVGINATTTEDLVKYEPSLVIRKRYIGDSNGTLGIRGSNMFATARSMVFADGVPLHYLLQTRWSGAPRWSLVSADEIAQVEILYGPYSAEFSGNAMGGVILIETAIPNSRQVHVDLDYFVQDFSAYGFSDQLHGYKTFVSYGDAFGDLNVYMSYNRLENDSQPQSFYFDSRTPSATAMSVTGAIADSDTQGNPVLYFGDTGVETALVENVKLKFGYDGERWSSLVNLAIEDRSTDRAAANTYLRNQEGALVWDGQVVQDGQGMTIASSRLGASVQSRQSVSSGLRLRGDYQEQGEWEINLSDFRLLRDRTFTSSHALASPNFTGSGQVTDYGDTGWQTLDVKWSQEQVDMLPIALVSGIRYERYQLQLNVFDTPEWQRYVNQGYTSRSGGETDIMAGFVQIKWDVTPAWDVSLGGRYEHWRSRGGYYSQSTHDALTLVDIGGRTQQQFSPKFSLTFTPSDEWLWRYSMGRAYRFPIIEELFTQSQSYSAVVQAAPDLAPENGLHHNLTLDRFFDGGSLRVNVFYETVRDAIESQTAWLQGGGTVTTFAAIDRVETQGTELIVNRYGIGHPSLDVRLNLTYTQSNIADNTRAEHNSVEPSIEGNDYPRIPRWRSHVMMTYHMNDRWDISSTWQYATKSYGRLDNTDRAERVMGAQDGFSRWGLKTMYKITSQLSINGGIDNVTNQRRYVAHPWPGRSVYAGMSYDY
jgi:iron complex outermembrane receptor protein